MSRRLVATVTGVALTMAALTNLACSRGQAKEPASVKPGAKPNRLIHEKSPYLLQHAYNPVDWRPWGDEAFEVAKREDRPIFLSVGYSTCHWCHVMERESFEDTSVAELLNRWFVPVKVDREERPDIDRVYMNAAFALTGGGGWPLTVFLTPEGKPFYAGTYFPPDERFGRPGLRQVLTSVHQAWTDRRAQVNESAAQLTSAIERAMQVTPDTTGVRAEALARVAYEHLTRMFDERWGGFGMAPKFPQPSYLSLLFRESAETGDARARDMALVTLRRMAQGGIHDQLGGGFHRYSTDAEWRVPHFEKMLYDQAQLAASYLEAYQNTGDRFFADVARDVLEYVARDLGHRGGGFYSAEDADSPGPGGEPEEGTFYAWTIAEVNSILGEERARPFLDYYGFTEQGNFEHGKNVLHTTGTLEQTAERFHRPPADLEKELAADRARLFEARQRRPRPHLDDKILTAWNGLMISAYARAYQILGEPRDLERARHAADFLVAHCYDERSGTLLRRYRDGEAAIPGELTDYAFLVQGLLDLYEAGFDVRDLERALSLTDRQIALFWDESQGGFFDTADNASRLLVRSKEAHDGAEPSGNSVAVSNLARLGQMTGRPDLEQKARRTLELFGNHVARSPLALTQMWSSAHLLSGRPMQIVIAGDPRSEGTRELLAVVRSRFLPRAVVLLADGGRGQEWLAERLPFLRALSPASGRATAYVCEDFACKLPTGDTGQLAKLLAAHEPALARP